MFKLLVLLVAVATVWGLPNSGRFPLMKSGRSIPGSRIVGGHDADIADYPYQLALTYFGYEYCGASLLGPKWALTAAACTNGAQPGQITVVAGSADLTGGQVVQVAAIHQHPEYNYVFMDADVSILELAEEITVANSAPIALHDSGYNAEEGTDITVTGWGDVEDGGPSSDVLQVVETKVVGNEACDEAYEGLITDRMMCVGNWEEGGEGPCVGDSGSPLVVNGKQYAVVSWGYGCGQPHYPIVNARVTEESLRKFVRNITGL